jgi:hypothetical protein
MWILPQNAEFPAKSLRPGEFFSLPRLEKPSRRGELDRPDQRARGNIFAAEFGAGWSKIVATTDEC